MKFDTITFPYLNRQCFRRPLPVSNPILCFVKPNNDGIQMSVRFKFQRSSALKCIEGLAWTGAQTDIFVGGDVALERNIRVANLSPRSFLLTLVRDIGVKHLLLSLL